MPYRTDRPGLDLSAVLGVWGVPGLRGNEGRREHDCEEKLRRAELQASSELERSDSAF